MSVNVPAQEIVLLPDAVRTSTTPSADQVFPNAKGVIVFLNVAAASGTGGLTVVIQAKDPASGNYITIGGASAAATATGIYCYALYPGITAEGTHISNAVISPTWRVNVQHGDSSNYEYSVGAGILF